MNNVYDNLRAIRQEKGFSQEYVAEKLNINQGNYARLERGETQLTIERLELIATIFNVDVYEILHYGQIEEAAKNIRGKIKEVLSKEDFKPDIEELVRQRTHILETEKKLLEREIDLLKREVELSNKNVSLLNRQIDFYDQMLTEQDEIIKSLKGIIEKVMGNKE